MILEIKNVTKDFPNERGGYVRALEDISFGIDEMEIVGILGPSGCGKTTLLRVIAGLEPPTSGEVLLNGSRIIKPNSKMGMVFQEYSLLPWCSIADNVAIGLDMMRIPKEERDEKVKNYLGMVGLQDFADHYPYELSGGMRQRAAVVRALTVDPSVLLMDEPFSALDPQTRNMIQSDILEIRASTKKTIILVTHSVEEAVFLSDRLIILSAKPGRVHEIIPITLGKPRDKGSVEFNKLRMHVLDLIDKLKVD
ncbi:MAG TPA: ABC transporter ATP-binding protein [Methanotrichaceae archaeon]|nr:ABC transporter ATP-binding protein [Methanotrichaceae archaeon]